MSDEEDERAHEGALKRLKAKAEAFEDEDEDGDGTLWNINKVILYQPNPLKPGVQRFWPENGDPKVAFFIFVFFCFLLSHSHERLF